MFTWKAILYFSLAVILLILGLFLNDFQLVILVFPIAALFVLTNLLGLPEKLDVKIDRLVEPTETFGNEPIKVITRVRNDSKNSLSNVEFQETYPKEVSLGKGSDREHVTIGSGSTIQLVSEFQSPGRGRYTIGPSIIRAKDPFGFYVIEQVLEGETLTVVPRPEKMRGISLRPHHLGPWPGNIPSKVRGIGSEFYSMRLYLPGDDPKKINWKATARQGRLIVNETEAERVTDVMVVVDTDIAFFEQASHIEVERRVTAGASIASLLLRQGNRVGLVLQGETRGSLPAGFGKRHERRILYQLSMAKAGRSTLATSYVINFLARRMLPSRSQIVMITPLLDPEIIQGIRELAQTGYSLLIISPTPLPPSHFNSETEEIAYRMVMLERSNIILALEKTASVVHWPSNVPLSMPLARMRQRRIMRT